MSADIIRLHPVREARKRRRKTDREAYFAALREQKRGPLSAEEAELDRLIGSPDGDYPPGGHAA